MIKRFTIYTLLVTLMQAMLSLGSMAAEASAGSFACEFSGAANFAASRFFVDMQEERNATLNTYGGDLSFLYTLDKNNSLLVRLGYAGGTAGASIVDSWVGGSDMHFFDYELNTFYLMLGNRYTVSLSGKAAFFCGVNVGAINHSIKSKTSSLYSAGEYKETHEYAEHASEWGVVCAVEAGFIVDLSENSYLMAAYQFSASTSAPEIGSGEGSISSDFQSYNSIRLGVGYRF